MRIIFFGAPLSWSVFCIYYKEQLEYKPCAKYEGFKCPLKLTTEEIDEKEKAFAKALEVTYAFFPPQIKE